MGFQTGSGTTLGISLTAPASHNEAGLDALSFTNIGEITNAGGEFGKEWALVTHNSLASRGVKKRKGSYNNGNLNPSLAYDPSDAGQQALKTALNSDDPAYFMMTLQDGTVFYFEALVMSAKVGPSDGDSVVTGSTSLEVTDEEIIEKAA